MSSTIEDLKANEEKIRSLEEYLALARQRQRDLHEKALREICPFASMERRDIFIPIGKTQAIISPVLSVKPPHVDGGPYRWEARGKQVRFRRGIMESIREGRIDQPAYEALDEEVRTLTRQDMVESTKKQPLTGAGKPLKLTERQLSMFAALANTIEDRRFDTRGVEGGQKLPGGIWDSQSSTQQIWLSMLKRGVLELVQGEAGKNYMAWRVNPGPRFEEAVSLVLDGGFLKEGSFAYERAVETFRPERVKAQVEPTGGKGPGK